MAVLVADQPLELVVDDIAIGVKLFDLGLAGVVLKEREVELCISLSCDKPIGNFNLVLNLLVFLMCEGADVVFKIALVLLNLSLNCMMLVWRLTTQVKVCDVVASMCCIEAIAAEHHQAR